MENLEMSGNLIVLLRLRPSLLDVEYYCDPEMWVRGHSKSLKLVPFESLGAVSYSPSLVTMAVSVAICEHYLFSFFYLILISNNKFSNITLVIIILIIMVPCDRLSSRFVFTN